MSQLTKSFSISQVKAYHLGLSDLMLHFVILHLHTDEQYVDVTTESGAIGQDLLHATKQHAEQSLLHIVVTVNWRSTRLRQEVKNTLALLGEGFALRDVFTGNGRDVIILTMDKVVGQQYGLESAGSVTTLLAWEASEGGNNL